MIDRWSTFALRSSSRDLERRSSNSEALSQNIVKKVAEDTLANCPEITSEKRELLVFTDPSSSSTESPSTKTKEQDQSNLQTCSKAYKKIFGHSQVSEDPEKRENPKTIKSKPPFVIKIIRYGPDGRYISESWIPTPLKNTSSTKCFFSKG
ncbi:MAG: hypothetical protein V4489_02425 [Chlamydiota bacterium]